MRLFSIVAALLLGLLVLTSCGGGGGGGGAAVDTVSRTLTVSVGGTAALIGGLKVDVILPPGVTVKAASNGSVTALTPPSLAALASNVLLDGAYTPATANARGKVRVGLLSTAGFATGGIFTLQCDVAPASIPRNADFVLSILEAFDNTIESNPLTGLSLSATLGQ
jgi:hypothetical protein